MVNKRWYTEIKWRQHSKTHFLLQSKTAQCIHQCFSCHFLFSLSTHITQPPASFGGSSNWFGINLGTPTTCSCSFQPYQQNCSGFALGLPSAPAHPFGHILVELCRSLDHRTFWTHVPNSCGKLNWKYTPRIDLHAEKSGMWTRI